MIFFILEMDVKLGSSLLFKFEFYGFHGFFSYLMMKNVDDILVEKALF